MRDSNRVGRQLPTCKHMQPQICIWHKSGPGYTTNTHMHPCPQGASQWGGGPGSQGYCPVLLLYIPAAHTNICHPCPVQQLSGGSSGWDGNNLLSQADCSQAASCKVPCEPSYLPLACSKQPTAAVPQPPLLLPFSGGQLLLLLQFLLS